MLVSMIAFCIVIFGGFEFIEWPEMPSCPKWIYNSNKIQILVIIAYAVAQMLLAIGYVLTALNKHYINEYLMGMIILAAMPHIDYWIWKAQQYCLLKIEETRQKAIKNHEEKTEAKR